MQNIPRRSFLQLSAMACTTPWLRKSLFEMSKPLERTIPSSGETIPMVGMGSWLTFDVDRSSSRKENMGQVLSAFVQHGGKVIDSSPMYGSSEKVIGDLSEALNLSDQLWMATKVWTNGEQSGKDQITRSQSLMRGTIRLNQIHNLRDLRIHYNSLRQMKEEGQLQYIGVTHYLSSEHTRLIKVLKDYPVDFLQINYNIDNTNADQALLPAAADLGVAVIINRPFQTGRLFDGVRQASIPAWAEERGVKSWATYFLKFILANPHVTCTIPATTQVSHVIENLESASGWIPSLDEQQKMLKDYQNV